MISIKYISGRFSLWRVVAPCFVDVELSLVPLFVFLPLHEKQFKRCHILIAHCQNALCGFAGIYVFLRGCGEEYLERLLSMELLLPSSCSALIGVCDAVLVCLDLARVDVAKLYLLDSTGLLFGFFVSGVVVNHALIKLGSIRFDHVDDVVVD